MSVFKGGTFNAREKTTTLKESGLLAGESIVVVIKKVFEQVNTRNVVTILDYGCANAIEWHQPVKFLNGRSLPEVIGEKLQGFYRYDPCHPLYSRRPSGKFDIVICSEVLEHVPEEELPSLLEDIGKCLEPKGIAIFSVCLTKSSCSFLDGTNFHVTVKPKEWWIDLFKKHAKYSVSLSFSAARPKENNNSESTKI